VVEDATSTAAAAAAYAVVDSFRASSSASGTDSSSLLLLQGLGTAWVLSFAARRFRRVKAVLLLCSRVPCRLRHGASQRCSGVMELRLRRVLRVSALHRDQRVLRLAACSFCLSMPALLRHERSPGLFVPRSLRLNLRAQAADRLRECLPLLPQLLLSSRSVSVQLPLQRAVAPPFRDKLLPQPLLC
jgi:hypothetical protein